MVKFINETVLGKLISGMKIEKTCFPVHKDFGLITAGGGRQPSHVSWDNVDIFTSQRVCVDIVGQPHEQVHYLMPLGSLLLFKL